MYKFSRRSKENLSQCDEDLQKVANEAIRYFDFSVICGHRGKEKQNRAHEKGNSDLKWSRSRHNSMPSTAMDLAPYPINWTKEKRFLELGNLILDVAYKLDIEIEWGGHWKKPDLPHYQTKGRK